MKALSWPLSGQPPGGILPKKNLGALRSHLVASETHCSYTCKSQSNVPYLDRGLYSINYMYRQTRAAATII